LKRHFPFLPENATGRGSAPNASVIPTGLEPEHVSSNSNKNLRRSSDSSAAQSGAFSTRFGSADPELVLLIDRWLTLPDATKAAIVAMVKTHVKTVC
jgi:hypothetical protein